MTFFGGSAFLRRILRGAKCGAEKLPKISKFFPAALLTYSDKIVIIGTAAERRAFSVAEKNRKFICLWRNNQK